MNDNVENLRAVIKARQAGKAYEAVSTASGSPGIAAVISKLTSRDATQRAQFDQRGNTRIDAGNQTNFNAVSGAIIQKDRDSETIKQLFPEMELGAQILVSSILAPKDMATTEILYLIPDNLKVSLLAAELLPKLEEYFTQTYKIEPLLPEILNEVLFGSGSYPMAVIPESSVDDLINGTSQITTESMAEFVNADGVFHPIGLLGPSDKSALTKNFALEDFAGSGRFGAGARMNVNLHAAAPKLSIDETKPVTDIRSFISVTDNPYGLKMPSVIRARQDRDVADLLTKRNRFFNTGFEDFKEDAKKSTKLNDIQLTNLFYKNKGVQWNQTVKVKSPDELKRHTIGKPLPLRLPSESVMPVFRPGNPEEHVGYFVLIDSEGNPIYKTAYQSEFNQLRRANLNSNMASSLLQQAGREMGNMNCDAMSFDQAALIYTDIVEADLLSRLRNGVYGAQMSLSSNEEIYRIMLARTLRKQNTQLLYIPIELVTYFAYKYNTQGIGKSLFDDTLTLQSLRGMMLFSQVQGAVKNAVGRQKVNIKFTEEDPNPQQTAEKLIHEIFNMKQGSFPVSALSVPDLAAWVQRSGLEFQFEGHPAMPDTQVEFSETQTNHQKPDMDLQEFLRRSSIMAMGLSPETVDSAFSTEFATTAIQNNLLLTKRVIQIQEVIVPQISDHARKVARNDGDFIKVIYSTIKANLDKLKESVKADPMFGDLEGNDELLVHLLAQEFFSGFEVNLNRPDAAQVENTLKAIEDQGRALDAAVMYMVTDEIFPESMVGAELAQRVNEMRAMIKAQCMRKWMADKRILPELFEFTEVGKDGKPTMKMESQIRAHMQNVTTTVVEMLKMARPVAAAADLAIQGTNDGQALGESAVGSASSSGGSSSSSSDGGGDGFDSGSGGGDDTGGGGPDDGGGLDDDLPGGLPPMPSF